MPAPFDQLSINDLFKYAFRSASAGELTEIAGLVRTDPSSPLEVTGSLTVAKKETLTIYNVTATTAGTEYSQALSSGTVAFTLRARSNARIQWTFESTQSGTNFLTIPAGASYTIEGNDLVGKTLYFQTNVSGTIVEIEEWT